MKMIVAKVAILTFIILPAAAISQESPGVTSFENGEYETAIREIREELESLGPDARLYNYLGLAYLKLKHHDAAKGAFKNAIKLDCRNPAYRANLAAAYIELFKMSDAVDQANYGLAVDPNHRKSLLMLSTAMLYLGKPETALEHADTAVLLNPTSMDAYLVQYSVRKGILGKEWQNGIERRIAILEQIREGLEQCLNTCFGERSVILDELKEIDVFLSYYRNQLKASNPGGDESSLPAGCKPLKITKRSAPSYPPRARKGRYTGAVKLAAMFGRDGKVGSILPLNDVGGGFTEQAIIAIRKIGFEPKVCDGKAEDAAKTLIYRFSMI